MNSNSQAYLLAAIVGTLGIAVIGICVTTVGTTSIMSLCGPVLTVLVVALQAERNSARTAAGQQQIAAQVATVDRKANVVVGKVDLAATKATEAKEAVAEVKSDLAASDKRKLAAIGDLANLQAATHDLVNGSLTSQLQVNAALARRVADLTKGTEAGPADEEAAVASERKFQEHSDKVGR